MTRAEQETAAIIAEQEVARKRAPRAHAFAEDIRAFLYGRDSSHLTREQMEKWEMLACALADHGRTLYGKTYTDVNEADEKHYRAEFERLKAPRVLSPEDAQAAVDAAAAAFKPWARR